MKHEKSRHKIAQMFDQIADRYDQTNRFLSLGQDRKWRKKLIKYLPKLDSFFIVDLACGTGDQILALQNVNATFFGLDISMEMLKIARKKFKDNQKVKLMLGSALEVPLDDVCSDVVTMSFGIRNVNDPSLCIREISRILKPAGRALILEFSKPTNPLIRSLSGFYINSIVPWIGTKISKKKLAYSYLPNTIEEFPSGDEFIKMMEDNGLTNCRQVAMNFGTVSLYIGEKSSMKGDL